ncbi:MAG: excinuclease ABC subunit UvrB [Patescibacteria group bacterium]|nr:excinuclease ABC subunit UvrB [Patescibacteria group bacterium]
MKFQLKSDYQPTGDQPRAIKQLVKNAKNNHQDQVLLGVTGSGKTFTMANVIQKIQKPTLVIAHNKTLAAQLYQEFRDFFPNNAVSYFVSYYDYYQPEAYIPTTDTYIAKEAQINDEIDKLRLAATTNLLTRKDVIVAASVSCIYNLGSPVEFDQNMLEIVEGEVIPRQTLMLQFTDLQYQRAETDLVRGSYRLRGDTIQLWPAYQNTALQIETLENRITKISEIEPMSGVPIKNLDKQQSLRDHKGRYIIYPAKHYIVDPQEQKKSFVQIEKDLSKRIKELKSQGKELEAFRIEKKVRYDLEMIEEFGFVSGIENYSRYFDGRKKEEPPYTLIDFFKKNVSKFKQDSFLTIIDESHMTVPQIGGMFAGDRSRKETLIKYGFRLPSALDNRPLRFPEFLNKTQQRVYISATPKDWEIEKSKGRVVEQLIRPTGLLDPSIELRSSQNQIQDLIIEIIKRVNQNQRVLVTTLTKRMAEDLTDYLNDKKKINKLVKAYLDRDALDRDNLDKNNLDRDKSQKNKQQTNGCEFIPINKMILGPIDSKQHTQATISTKQLDKNLVYPQVAYLHSEIETLERSDILNELRQGKYDVVVGINLLREGLDLPEVSLVAILDADKAGFLRSETALVQTMGRAARHEQGRAILYADYLSKAMKNAISETQRRRKVQQKFNQDNNITPTTINKPIRKRLLEKKKKDKQPSENSEFGPIIIRISKKETIDLSEIKPDALTPQDKKRLINKLERRMRQAARDLDFELATVIRDTVHTLRRS